MIDTIVVTFSGDKSIHVDSIGNLTFIGEFNKLDVALLKKRLSLLVDSVIRRTRIDRDDFDRYVEDIFGTKNDETFNLCDLDDALKRTELDGVTNFQFSDDPTDIPLLVDKDLLDELENEPPFSIDDANLNHADLNLSNEQFTCPICGSHEYHDPPQNDDYECSECSVRFGDPAKFGALELTKNQNGGIS